MAGRTPNIKLYLAVFDFIIEYKRTHDGNSPGLQVIGAAIGKSHTTARSACLWLEHDGLIRMGEGRCSIEVVGGLWTLTEP